MNEPIVSIAMIERIARWAVDGGKPMSACPFPLHSEASAAWRIAHQVRVDELKNKVAG